jgi:hypothetical protein
MNPSRSTSSNGVHRPPAPAPAPPPAPTRVIDLATVVLDDGDALETVSPLGVRDVKGAGNYITANYDLAQAYQAVAHKAAGSYDTTYQLLSGGLASDPRLRPLVRAVVFMPAYAWGDGTTVLLPVRGDGYGQAVLLALRTLQRQFPGYRAFRIWDDARKRHVVKWVPLDPAERAILDRHAWPTPAEIVEALSADAFDSIEALAEANPAVRAILTGKEVG